MSNKWQGVCNVQDQEPLSFNQATKMEVWNDAMKAELEALDKNGTWEFTKLPSGVRPITSR